MKEKHIHDQKDHGKEKYEKPRLEEIELFTDEVLGLSCKTTPSSEPASTSVCNVGSCFY